MSSDWPRPVEILNPVGMSDIVLLCEHASNHIPAEYKGLGLTPHELGRHIAWDIGAAEVTRQLSVLLDAPAYLASYSRLLIDLNRPLGSAGSIVTRSEDTDVPGNVNLTDEEVTRRTERIFQPFHQHVSECLNQRQKDGRLTRLVTIHSFTPVYKGIARPWHAGVLFDAAKDFGQDLIVRLRKPGLIVDANVPYQTDRAEDYAVPIQGDDRGIPAVLIEIRQDMIGDEAGVSEWAERLAQALLPEP
jgi:predicted N-formylglutamate amidohydrolase